MTKKLSIRNDITYTTEGHEGLRYENTVAIDRPYTLTAQGAQRILRRHSPTAIVSLVSSCRYSN
jgi:hypothetical protein